MVETAPQFFDRLADRYDQVVPFFGELAKELLDILDPAVGTRLLDLGTGRGAIATAAAARGCTVTAVDAAPRMVGLLAAAHPEIDARLMDIHDLDLPDHSYDLATAGFVVHLVADRPRVLAGLRRVLRPGARAALTVPGPCEDGGRWDEWNALIGRFAARSTEPRLPRDYGSVTPDLTAAGFVDIRTAGFAVHMPIADPQTCWDFHMSHGFAAIVESLDPADAAEFRRCALAELTRMHESGGIVLDRGAVLYLAINPDDT
ncbi:MAG TPA: methyltransferase domain-containing protein [Actinocrinis sp.]|jgi:SAM-dependent methyltransferase